MSNAESVSSDSKIHVLETITPQNHAYTYHICWAWYNGSYAMATKPIQFLELHYTMTQFLIITLIPKKTEEHYKVKNCKPLTLLNCDYKIVTKAIANCLNIHLHKLINNDQTGFLKGRFIGENIRLIDSVVN